MRNISCSLTIAQVRARTKTVTRRLGWESLKVGDHLQLCEKCMGRKKGEPLVKLAVVEIVSTRREPLRRMYDDIDYGFAECALEGFGEDMRLKWPSEFVSFFIDSHRADPKTKKLTTPETLVTRIEWRYLD